MNKYADQISSYRITLTENAPVSEEFRHGYNMGLDDAADVATEADLEIERLKEALCVIRDNHQDSPASNIANCALKMEE